MTDNPEAYATKSEKREHGIATWRADLLSRRTRPWQWAGIVLLYIALAFLVIAYLPPLVAVLMCVGLTLCAWLAIHVLIRRDANISALSKLTPIIDMTTYQGQATILRRSTDLLLERLNDKFSSTENVLFAMQAVLNAARPIMERGGIEPQTARAEGYPGWPEVDRTEMPTAPGDFLSVHAMRLDATAHNLVRISQERIAFDETVARIAGEVVPPLRAIEAVIAPESQVPIPTMEIDGASA